MFYMKTTYLLEYKILTWKTQIYWSWRQVKQIRRQKYEVQKFTVR